MTEFLKNITGFSIPLIGGGLSWKNEGQKNFNTKISLMFHGDHRTPEPIRLENIFRWYALQNIIKNIDDNSVQRKTWFLFLVFDRPIDPKYLRVSFSSNKHPIAEVKDFSPRSAIIVFDNEIPVGTVTIEADQ